MLHITCDQGNVSYYNQEIPLHIYCCCLVAEYRVRLFATPRTIARQAPLSMGFPRQEYWGGLPFAFPGNLPEPGIKAKCPAL